MSNAQFAQRDTNTLLMVLITLILPPVAVYLARGLTAHFWLNIVLTLVGWLPGVIHALWLLMSDRSELAP